MMINVLEKSHRRMNVRRMGKNQKMYVILVVQRLTSVIPWNMDQTNVNQGSPLMTNALRMAMLNWMYAPQEDLTLTNAPLMELKPKVTIAREVILPMEWIHVSLKAQAQAEVICAARQNGLATTVKQGNGIVVLILLTTFAQMAQIREVATILRIIATVSPAAINVPMVQKMRIYVILTTLTHVQVAW